MGMMMRRGVGRRVMKRLDECGTLATMHDLNGFALFGLSEAFGRRD